MTEARNLRQNWTYMLTRRCAFRRYYFLPCFVLNLIFLILLKKYAKQYKLRIHGFVVLSNHYHLILTDPNRQSTLPDFTRDFHSALTRFLNPFYQRSGPIFDHGRCSLVRITTKKALFETLLYIVLNPVEARLVSQPSEWPGLVTLPSELQEGFGRRYHGSSSNPRGFQQQQY